MLLNKKVTKQNIRRAGARWREEAPEFFVDAFDLGEKFSDRYTIVVLPVIEVDNQKWVMVINSSEQPNHPQGVFIINQMRTYDVSNFRYRNGHNRIAWKDLPIKVRESLTDWALETV